MTEIIRYINDVSPESDRLAMLDFGGTLAERGLPSTHATYNMAFGMGEEQEFNLYKRHAAQGKGIRDHDHHAAEQTEIIKEVSNHESELEVFTKTTQYILDQTELADGACEFVQDLSDENYVTVLVSSAPVITTLPYAEELDIDYVYDWKRYEFDEEDFQQVSVNPEARKGKHQIVNKLQDRFSEIAHFGNGANDTKAIEAADTGLKRHREEDLPDFYDRIRKEVIENEDRAVL